MSLIRGQSSAVESSIESIKFNFSSLSLNNAIQDISLSSYSDQSSPCMPQQCQINDIGARSDHVGIVPSLVENAFSRVPGSTGNLISEDDDDQSPILSAGGADDDSDDVAEIRLSMGSSYNADHPLEVSSSLRKQEDISSGSKVSISYIADMTREVQGGSRRTFEVGSSSGPRQKENNLSNNFSIHLNDSSSHASSMLPWNLSLVTCQEYPVLRTNIGLHSSSSSHHHPTTSIHPEMPPGNFNPGLNMSCRQYPTLFDALIAAGSPRLHLVLNVPLSPLPMWLNDFPVGYSPSISPDMSRMEFVPSVSGNLPQLPLTINSNSRAGSSTERRLLPDLRGHSHHPQHHSLAVGSCGALGAIGGASNHQIEHYSDFHQLPSLPLAPPSTSQVGRRQTELQYLPGFLSPWNDPGSGVRNLNFSPSPNPATYGHNGNSIFGHNPYFLGSSTSQSVHHLRRPGVPHTFQSMEDEVEINHRPMSEATLLPPAQYVHHTTFGYLETMFLQDMHQDMRLDADNMSYEDLLALGEHIGNVSTGLREETIMELLKQRHYECVVKNSILDDETCCICREEYVHGEDIGELNCGHEFHTGCVKQWLVIKNTCPICQLKGLGA